MGKFDLEFSRALHPLDLAQDAAEKMRLGQSESPARAEKLLARSLTHERLGADELQLHLPGAWCDCTMTLEWHESARRLHLTAQFGIEAPAPLRARAEHVVALLNEFAPAGHFGFWPGRREIVYRNALILCRSPVSTGQCEEMVLLAAEACQRSYLAFQLVLWGGRKPEEAAALSMMPVAGQA